VNDFFKFWTIANVVWGIVNNFVSSGGPAPNAALLAQEAAKEIDRRVYAGFLPPSIAEGKDAIIQTAVDYHPAVQNNPK
jgi:hypothetical protein